MTRRWVGVAVIAGCLAWAQAAPAQVAPGAPGAPAPLPEPIPFSPGAECGPNLVPGPVGPSNVPPGPADCLSLPDDGTGAFPCKECCPEEAWYFHVGALALRRQGLGSDFTIAVRDPQNLDTGNPPPAGAPVLQSLSQLDPHFNSGTTATLGFLWGEHAVELTGYYLFQGNRSRSVVDPGQIDSFFVNTPLGFEGDNGMFLQADRLTSAFSSTLWNVEANYRYTSPALQEAELIVGARYFDLDERISSTFDDDGIAFPLVNGLPDPTRVATYSVRTHNRFMAPQLGFEWDHPLLCWLSLGLGAKGAWGADNVELERQLVRGDGFQGFNGSHSTWQFSHLYEINSFVDIRLLERAKLRLGYNAMWFLHMANVGDQYDFNLQNTTRLLKDNGNVFFHGPLAQLEFLF